MTNHAPTFTSSSATGSFSENTNSTNSAALHAMSGTMSFRDSDSTDTHTTSAALSTVSWSGGSTIPTASRSDLNAAMSSAILTDHNGSGTLKWSFSAADRDFDFLAKNETLVLTYNITVSDNHGGTVKQTVKVTVTGTDDKPVINLAAMGSVTEQAGQTLSLSADTTHVALQFVDADLDNTGHTATVTGVSASGSTAGILPGSLGTAELMAFFHIDNVTKAAGSANGTINTTFSAPDLAFDYLAAGEHLDITYTVQLDDHAGGVSSQSIIITVVGTNDKPLYLSGPDTAHLIEGTNVSPSGNLTAHGDFLFGDIDLSDTHTVSTTVSASRSGGGTVPLSNAALLAALSTMLDDSNGQLLGEVDWNFAIANSDVSFLSAGETLTLNYNVTVKDAAGGSATQTVTVTILGTNHPVVITSGPQSASVSELTDTTGSATADTAPTGTLNFTDTDTGDTHSVAVSVLSATSSRGAIPAATQAALATALATTLHDSTGTGNGSIDYSFSIPDQNFDFLAAGETLTVKYNVRVSDASTSANQTVTVTATGANDTPTITSGPETASVSERAGTSASSAPDTATGTLNFSDVDLSDTHSVNVALASAIWSVDPSFVPPDTLADLATALATTLHDSTGSGAGSVGWTFSIADKDLDFLSAGDTLTVTYDVTVQDGAASSTQTVTITLNGAADALVVGSAATTAPDTAAANAGQFVATGLITDLYTGGDLGTSPVITAVNGQASNVGQDVAGTYGSLSMDAAGFYQYTANADLDRLQVGQNATDQFEFTVTDNQGRTVTTTLTFNIAGADDAPVVTGAQAFGTVIEDAGPAALVNGGFETGDFTGWSQSSGATVELLSIGGGFGDYSARLGGGSLVQDIVTSPFQHYTLSFAVAGDAEAEFSSFAVLWNGAQVFGTSDVALGFTTYTFDVVGAAFSSTTELTFNFNDRGPGMFLDQVTVNATTGPATESTSGSVSFSDIETGDTHTASFQPDNAGYVGTFSLDPVSEASGTGSVAWHFTVNNADIQFLAQGQSIDQTYLVSVTGNHGAATSQEVTVTLTGANDAPTAVDDTIITDVGANGTVDIPAWALAANDTDPDTSDTLAPNAIVSSTGGTAVPFIDAFFIDDATPGGSFTYTVTDGMATSGEATATVVNGPAAATLTGTGGADIIVSSTVGSALVGAGGNDVLVGYGGGHSLTGGTGNDYFAFQQPSDGPNTITDFNNTTQHDHIAILANGFGLAAGSDTSSLFEASGDDQYSGAGAVFHFDTANQTLYYSADGTTASEVALAHLQPGAVLHAQDLILV